MKKRIFRPFVYLFILTSFFLSAQGFASNPVSADLAPMLQKVLPAVVNVRAKIKITDITTLNRIQHEQQSENSGKNGDMPIPDSFMSAASGVIVDANKGYILTNAHVVADAQTVTVTLSDGRHYSAKIIGLDKPSDVGLLQIKAKDLTAIPISDSNALKVGDFVAAIGNPFGLNQTVTSGIVSALGRTTLGIESFENFIQTDAPINPGNSGGALINIQGQLVGINTAILAPNRGSVGIGFAIPANMAKSVMQQLIQFGNVQRGALGIGAQDVTPELASAFDLKTTKGAVISQILPGSPAQEAGLQVGDIITAVNGSEVKNANDVVNTVGFLRVNSKINLKVLRDNKSTTISAELSDPKKRKEIREAADPFLFGLALEDFSILSPNYGDVKGVLVVGVDEDTNAGHSGLRPNDVIISADSQKVTTIAELKKIVSDSKKSKLLLNVLREPGAMFLTINRESE